MSTRNRFELLVNRSLKSVVNQSVLPDKIIIVNDGRLFSSDELSEIRHLLTNIYFIILNTKGGVGLASALNVGLEYLYQYNDDNYIAILDDDDCWDSCHGEVCLRTGYLNNANVVITGLRLYDAKSCSFKSRSLLSEVGKREFLIGNPGWQGSNTFVLKSAFKEVNGFTDGLLSCNDRDLAYRLLSLSSIKIAYTNQFTATWFINEDFYQLSNGKNPKKKKGLLQFWEMYKSIMTEKEKECFIERTNKLFNIETTIFI